jgi:hypothetical protein
MDGGIIQCLGDSEHHFRLFPWSRMVCTGRNLPSKDDNRLCGWKEISDIRLIFLCEGGDFDFGKDPDSLIMEICIQIHTDNPIRS